MVSSNVLAQNDSVVDFSRQRGQRRPFLDIVISLQKECSIARHCRPLFSTKRENKKPSRPFFFYKKEENSGLFWTYVFSCCVKCGHWTGWPSDQDGFLSTSGTNRLQ
eukprot:GEMP01094064.1.p3 GENE.GEMP01094064.1~~GEMP01094064.1.p3  ORF type:complete len:107 (-),score=13.87 GEMP01094064.1:268-588(-)